MGTSIYKKYTLYLIFLRFIDKNILKMHKHYQLIPTNYIEIKWTEYVKYVIMCVLRMDRVCPE